MCIQSALQGGRGWEQRLSEFRGIITVHTCMHKCYPLPLLQSGTSLPMIFAQIAPASPLPDCIIQAAANPRRADRHRIVCLPSLTPRHRRLTSRRIVKPAPGCIRHRGWRIDPCSGAFTTGWWRIRSPPPSHLDIKYPESPECDPPMADTAQTGHGADTV